MECLDLDLVKLFAILEERPTTKGQTTRAWLLRGGYCRNKLLKVNCGSSRKASILPSRNDKNVSITDDWH